MAIDRDVYFDNVRDSMFDGAMTQQQVDGQNVIIALWDYQATGTPMHDLRWLSYMLATVFHETATKCWPIREYGEGKGHEYGEPNEDGNCFYGRGFVQLTWEENYDKASAALSLIDDRDLVKFPDMALDSLISARILFRGMSEGWFTGKKLGQYFSDTVDDPVGARKIINPDDKGELITGYHDRFLHALEEAYYEVNAKPATAPGWIGT
jgi:putative chitinase